MRARFLTRWRSWAPRCSSLESKHSSDARRLLMADPSTARAVKRKMSASLGTNKHVNGVGLSQRGGTWVVKVNLLDDDPLTRKQIPAEMDGVAVIVEVTGPVRARAV
jgi:hypothetical protein